MGTILSNLFFPLCTFVLENIYKVVLKLYLMWGLIDVFILECFKLHPKKLFGSLWTYSGIWPELRHPQSLPY
jgi:hypothetical protein